MLPSGKENEMFNVCRVDAGASPTDGPYSRAVAYGRIPVPVRSGRPGQDGRRRAVKKRKAVLERAGLTLGVRVNPAVFPADRVNFCRCTDVYKSYFSNGFARAYLPAGFVSTGRQAGGN